MTKKEIIEAIAREPKYREKCRVVVGSGPDHLVDDLYQEVFVSLLEMPDQRLLDIYQENFENYYFMVAARQFRSPSSRFHKTYIKPDLFIREKATDIMLYYSIFPADRAGLHPDLLRWFRLAMYELEQTDFVGAKLLQLHAESDMSIKDVAKESNVPRRSVYKIMQTARDNIKVKIQRYKRMKL